MKEIPDHRFGFGLTSFVMVLSLLTSIFSFGDQITDKQNAPPNPGPQQVVVTNTTAQPVPVSTPNKDYYQARQAFTCTTGNNPFFIPLTFVIPDNKKLILRYVSVFADSNGGPTQNYSAQIVGHNYAAEFWLPMTLLPGTPNPYFAGTQSLLMITDEVDVHVARSPFSQSCAGSVTISGELIPEAQVPNL